MSSKKIQPEGSNPLGTCVLSSSDGDVPNDLYQNTGIVSSTVHGPFTKTITVNGITLMGRAENDDQFMLDVAKTIEEMFPTQQDGIDSSLQETVIRHMYQRKTVIPLFKGDDSFNFTNEEEEQFDRLQENYSLCDVIFEFGSEGQTMEVIEHILHHVSMVGLHYTFPNEWGVHQDSLLHQYMTKHKTKIFTMPITRL